tara:strand:- start:534 stop:722 length:189 start_codon:yes stop_codon:yes gene_type:complete
MPSHILKENKMFQIHTIRNIPKKKKGFFESNHEDTKKSKARHGRAVEKRKKLKENKNGKSRL